MTILNPELTSETAMQLTQKFFDLQGISRPDLMAQTFLDSVQGLVLTPDYFCARVMHACSEPHYESISLDDDIAAILSDKPEDADHYIDRLYAELL